MKPVCRLVAAAVLAVCGQTYSFAVDQARVTLKTVDEEGNALPGVTVNASFYMGVSRKGMSDANGLFVLEGAVTGTGDTWYTLRKDGFYPSDGRYMLDYPKNGRYQPWNPVITTVVRRVIHPIPMFAKRVATDIPARNVNLGFDLAIGDWVAPYGHGNRSDFVFTFSNSVSGMNHYQGMLALTFTNALDGILRNVERSESSWYRFPRYAPEQGYQTNWIARYGRDPKSGLYGDCDVCGGGEPEKKSYFFRVRDTQAQGGMYGKIAGEIVVSGTGRMGSLTNLGVQLRFTYYLNPTPGDRNTECDINQSLIPDLKGTEKVSEP